MLKQCLVWCISVSNIPKTAIEIERFFFGNSVWYSHVKYYYRKPQDYELPYPQYGFDCHAFVNTLNFQHFIK